MSEEPRRGLDRVLHSHLLPAKLFGGRVRTSTLVLCVLWVVLYTLYTSLNPPEDSGQAPPPAPTISTPVPSEEPAPVTTLPSSTSETPTETTDVTTTITATTPESTPGSTMPSQSTQPTTTLPFGLPQLFPAPATPSPPTTMSPVPTAPGSQTGR
ncbi:hypothetical protein [Rhodococcus tibetensis]|uniref:Uncharacterized protein n=1 Tax=Rhodococcus tibetensis TaxID=2965064 RepID=A0ABT1QK00_9NOCA|nr:hypothetical protein [Rhodococcus sp. FXJ9.536]MCQ4121375.1 hypothetical protein [Rhodococcus sp. FXJ9.536]